MLEADWLYSYLRALFCAFQVPLVGRLQQLLELRIQQWLWLQQWVLQQRRLLQQQQVSLLLSTGYVLVCTDLLWCIPGAIMYGDSEACAGLLVDI